MQIEKKSLPKSQYEFQITISVEELNKFRTKAAKKISESHTFPGFRPGTAPLEIVEGKLGVSEVLEEAANMAVSDTLTKILKDENLFPVSMPKITVLKLAAGNDFSFTATITVLPAIKLPEWGAVKKAKRKEIKIDEKEVDKQMEEIRKQYRKEALKNSAAQNGDMVTVSFTVSLNGVVIENGTYKDMPIIIGEKKMIPGFEDALIGLSAKEKKVFELTFPEKYHEKTLAGKKASFDLMIEAVYAMELPELDDVFAQSLGKFQSLDELKQEIKNRLMIEAENKEAQRMEQEMLENVLEKTEIDELPDDLVLQEQERMISEMKQEMISYRLKWDDYLTHLKKTEEEVKKGYEKPATERVKASLLIRAVADQEAISASDEELDAEQEKALEIAKGDENRLNYLKSPEFRDRLSVMITNRKVIAFLKQQTSDSSK